METRDDQDSEPQRGRGHRSNSTTALETWGSSEDPGDGAPAAVTSLTILYHPDTKRIGDQAALAGLAPEVTFRLSRAEPDFSGSDEPQPLGDRNLSRAPLLLVGLPGGYFLYHGLIARVQDTEMFRLPAVDPVPAWTWALVVSLAFGLASHAVVQRSINRTDWLAALNVRE